MNIELISEILGWTSVAFYISITIFNTMKVTRYAAFGSAGNDVIWAFLMGWWPKVILNLAVASVNSYRYARDFTNVSRILINVLAVLMAAGIGYIGYVAVNAFIATPGISEAIKTQYASLIADPSFAAASAFFVDFIMQPKVSTALQFADLGIILLALYMTSLTRYRQLMLFSGFIGMAAYFGNEQMMIIKTIVIGIMTFKLLFDKPQAPVAAAI